MKRILLLSLLFLTLGLHAQKKQETKPGKMNVILFLVDDLGYHDLTKTGSKLYDTPNIDALAQSGMFFTQAYASHPRCVPSRYGIQTGKFPARGKVPGGKGALKKTDETLGQAFKKAGYATFFAGKWHLGHTPDLWPQNEGYDYNYGGCSAGAPISYFYPYNTPRNPNAKGHHRPIVGLDNGHPGEYLTDHLTDETVKFIKSHKDVPFFAMLSHYGVHTPFEAKKEMIKKYKQRMEHIHYTGPDYIEKDGITKMHQDNVVYAAMIQSVDESLGKIIKALKEAGIYDKTAIVFTSDHGGLSNKGVGNHRELATSNMPLRAGKGHLLEGGVKVPFIVYWPGKVKPGSTTSQVTSNVDIYPTLLNIAGIKNTNKDIDGKSIVPQLEGKKPVKRTIYWHSPLPRPKQTGDITCSAIRVGDYKLLDFYVVHRLELYNIKKDPGETHNLAAEKPELAKKLDEELKAWKTSIHAIEFPHKNKKKGAKKGKKPALK
jgi:arylsulfatase A-like enzyme